MTEDSLNDNTSDSDLFSSDSALTFEEQSKPKNRTKNGAVSIKTLEKLVSKGNIYLLWEELKKVPNRHNGLRNLLEMACNNNDLETVKCLVRSGLDVASENGSMQRCSQSPISMEIKEFLLLAEKRQIAKKTALHVAAARGELEIVKKLLDFVEINAKDSVGFSALHDASIFGQTHVIEFLLSKSADINSVNQWGNTPLIESCIYSCEESVMKLLEFGADPFSKNNDNNSCLQYCSKSLRKVIKNFIDINNNLFQMKKQPLAAVPEPPVEKRKPGRPRKIVIADESAVSRVPQKKQKIKEESSDAKKAIKLDPNFRERSSGRSLLHKACIKGNLAAVKELISLGADINSRDNAGYSSLHEACIYEDLSVVKFLLENGASVNAIAVDGNTPLHEAVESENLDLIKCLLSSGANPNAINQSGLSPLLLSENNEIKALLNSYKQSFTDPSADNSVSPKLKEKIFKAVESGNTEYLKLLLAKTSCLEFKNERGLTILHECVLKGHVRMIELLLENGAFVNSFSDFGSTPLHIACELNNYVAAEILLKYGANIDLKNADNKIPSELTSEKSVLKLLKETRPSATKMFVNYSKRRDSEERFLFQQEKSSSKVAKLESPVKPETPFYILRTFGEDFYLLKQLKELNPSEFQQLKSMATVIHVDPSKHSLIPREVKPFVVANQITVLSKNINTGCNYEKNKIIKELDISSCVVKPMELPEVRPRVPLKLSMKLQSRMGAENGLSSVNNDFPIGV